MRFNEVNMEGSRAAGEVRALALVHMQVFSHENDFLQQSQLL